MVRTKITKYLIVEDENGKLISDTPVKRPVIAEYIDELYSYLANAGDKATLKGKVYDIWFLNDVFNRLMENNEDKIHKVVPDYYISSSDFYDEGIRNNAAIVLIFMNRSEFGLKKETEKALKFVEDSKEGERRLQIQAKIDRVNKQRAGTLKGFKTATYGRKKHRDNITQLENSVRKMW